MAWEGQNEPNRNALSQRPSDNWWKDALVQIGPYPAYVYGNSWLVASLLTPNFPSMQHTARILHFNKTQVPVLKHVDQEFLNARQLPIECTFTRYKDHGSSKCGSLWERSARQASFALPVCKRRRRSAETFFFKFDFSSESWTGSNYFYAYHSHKHSLKGVCVCVCVCVCARARYEEVCSKFSQGITCCYCCWHCADHYSQP